MAPVWSYYDGLQVATMAKRTRSPLIAKDDPSRKELLAKYEEVDRLLAPLSCANSADCCDFGLTGREPYPTAIELAELRRAIRSAGLDLSALSSPRKLPVAGSAGMELCPLLGPDRRCRVYASRPFGCRTFFCDRAEGPKVRSIRAEIQRLSRQIADLSGRFAPRDPHPRPLRNALKMEDRAKMR